jgi:hypothetical protein
MQDSKLDAVRARNAKAAITCCVGTKLQASAKHPDLSAAWRLCLSKAGPAIKFYQQSTWSAISI